MPLLLLQLLYIRRVLISSSRTRAKPRSKSHLLPTLALQSIFDLQNFPKRLTLDLFYWRCRASLSLGTPRLRRRCCTFETCHGSALRRSLLSFASPLAASLIPCATLVPIATRLSSNLWVFFLFLKFRFNPDWNAGKKLFKKKIIAKGKLIV